MQWVVREPLPRRVMREAARWVRVRVRMVWRAWRLLAFMVSPSFGAW
jgi:hypothetical protein